MNILLTSAGRRSYIVDYFRETLAGRGKVYTLSNTYDATAMFTSDGAFISPAIDSPDYIPFLLEICIKYRISLVIPLFDIDLPTLSSAKNAFHEIGVCLAVSDIDVINVCNDKWSTFNFLKEHAFCVAFSSLELTEVKGTVESNLAKFPFIIKPRWGMGSLVTTKSENFDELNFLNKIVKRGIRSSYLEKESKHDSSHTVIFQEWIQGEEFGVDVVNDFNGNYITSFVKRKLAMRAGETDSAETVHHIEIEKMCERLALLLRHKGNLDVDIIWSDNKGYIIDLNARLGGGYPFSHMAGANIPAAYIAWTNGQIANPEWFKIKYGVRGFKAISPIVQNHQNLIEITKGKA